MPTALRKPAASGKVSSTPARPPIAAISRLSPNSSRTTKPGENPSALSVAYSARRSRAVIVIVLAITAMMITTMIRLTARTATRMASLIETKLSWKAASVSVMVSASELANSWSTRWPTSAALLGSSMPTMYTPTASARRGDFSRIVSLT